MSARLSALNESVQSALDDHDEDIAAVVVTRDGWVVVTNEASIGAAQTLLDLAREEVSGKTEPGGVRE